VRRVLGAAAFLLWAFAYLVFLLLLVYLIGFLANRYTFSTIDSGVQIPTREALAVNVALLLLFAIQHSGMARNWKYRIPAALRRTLFLLATNAVLLMIFRFWEPMPAILFRIENAWWVWTIFFAGWALVFWASFACDHWGKFGLRHVLAWWNGREPAPPPFRTPGPYRWVRHPMMTGLLLAFWATPEMTAGHLLFSAAMSLYIVLGVFLEERDLVRQYGAVYEHYRRTTPAFFPRLGSLTRLFRPEPVHPPNGS